MQSLFDSIQPILKYTPIWHTTNILQCTSPKVIVTLWRIYNEIYLWRRTRKRGVMRLS